MESSVIYKNIRTRGKRPMRSLPLNEKVLAIQRIHNGETKASVSRSLGVPESTLRGWCKNEIKLRRMSEQTLMLETLSDTKLPEKRKRSNERANNVTTNLRSIKVEVLEQEVNNNNYKTAVNNKDSKDDLRTKLERITKEFYGSADTFDFNGRFADTKIAFPGQPRFLNEDSTTNDNSIEQNSETTTTFANVIETSSTSVSLDIELLQAANVPQIDANNSEFNLNNFNLHNMHFTTEDDFASMMQWCQMYISSYNLVQNKLAELERNKETTSVKSNKRTYDDPYTEIRNIYEANKQFDADISTLHNVYIKNYTDTTDDDCAEDDEQPEDLSIKSTR